MRLACTQGWLHETGEPACFQMLNLGLKSLWFAALVQSGVFRASPPFLLDSVFPFASRLGCLRVVVGQPLGRAGLVVFGLGVFVWWVFVMFVRNAVHGVVRDVVHGVVLVGCAGL